MRFKIAVDDKKDLTSFLSSTKTEYVDCFVYKESLCFVGNSVDYYVQYLETILERNDTTGDSAFRLKKDKLISLVDEGFIEFIVDYDKVEVLFYDKSDTFKYSLSFGNQIVDTNEYKDKMKLIANLHEYAKLDLSELDGLCRVARVLNTSVNVLDGFAYVVENNIRAFKSTKLPSFSVNGDALRKLIVKSKWLYNVGSYIGYMDSKLGILIRKRRTNETTDFSYIQKQKPTHKIDFSLIKLVSLFNKIKASDGTVELKIEDEKAEFVSDGITYVVDLIVRNIESKYSKSQEVPEDELNLENLDLNLDLNLDENVELTDVNKYSVHKLEKIIFPSYIVTKLLTLPGIDATELRLLIYKTSYILKGKNYSIVFGRLRDV